MKKNCNKHLRLSKETIRALDQGSLEHAAGGVTTAAPVIVITIILISIAECTN